MFGYISYTIDYKKYIEWFVPTRIVHRKPVIIIYNESRRIIRRQIIIIF